MFEFSLSVPRLIPKSPRPIRMIFHGLFFGVGALAGVAGSLSEAMNTYKTVLPEDSKFRKALESEERPHATFMGERIEIPTDGQSKKE